MGYDTIEGSSLRFSDEGFVFEDNPVTPLFYWRVLKNSVIGATVQITIGLKRQRRLAQPSYSYLSSNDHRVHFGIANADSVDKVDVVWPDGQLESFGSFHAGAVHELRKGTSIL